MSQSSNEASAANLPPQPSEQLPLPEVNPGAGVQSPERTAAAPERASQAAAPPTLPAPAIPLPTTPAASQSNNQDNPSDVNATMKSKNAKLVKDTDLIEKEWVDKAKRIVERNRDDPYKQSEELTEVRADYMKKIYNKTIKIDK